MQAFLHGGRSLTILENLWRGLDLYWILETSLSPKDQRELFVPFSKSCCTSFYMNSRDQLAHAVIGYSQLQGTDLYGQGIYVQGYPGSKFSFHYYHDLVVILLAVIIASYHPVMPCFHIRVNSHCQQ